MEPEGAETARRVGTASTPMEDYALRQVPADWPVVGVDPAPIRVGWVGQQSDDARSLGRPGEVDAAR